MFLISNAPFSEEDVQRVEAIAEAHDFIPAALPNRDIQIDGGNLFQELINAQNKSEFIDEYPFDITVPTDDRPFFMEHTKWADAWDQKNYIFNSADGHQLLLVTTLVVALLGVLFIVIPARFVQRETTSGVGRLSVLGFFSCLGLGYVLIEIVLVQKLTLYLGNPTHALAVALCALLIFSGIGSFLSDKLPGTPRSRLTMSCAAVALVLIGYRSLMDPIMQATLAADISVRIAIVLALLSLPATLMGMPFPTAVAALGDSRRDLVVGGWVVNGYFSVLGSCLAMVLSISFGFSGVLLIGAGIYAVAAIARPIPRES